MSYAEEALAIGSLTPLSTFVETKAISGYISGLLRVLMLRGISTRSVASNSLNNTKEPIGVQRSTNSDSNFDYNSTHSQHLTDAAGMTFLPCDIWNVMITINYKPDLKMKIIRWWFRKKYNLLALWPFLGFLKSFSKLQELGLTPSNSLQFLTFSFSWIFFQKCSISLANDFLRVYH